MMTSMRPALVGAALAATLGSCTPTTEDRASARVISDLGDAIGGPKALAGPGDFVLENGRVRVAILAATNPDGSERHSPGPHTRAGSLVDADLVLPDPDHRRGRGTDQFAELIPTGNMDITYTADPTSVRILADGSDGGPAILRTEGPREPFITLLDALWAITGAPDFYMSTDYILEPGKPWVRLETTYHYGPDAPYTDVVPEPMGASDHGMPLLEWALETGVVGGDFYLSGGSVDVFAPGIGFDEDGAVARADNTFDVPFQFPFVAGTANGVSYGIAPAEGDAYVPLFTSSQTVVVGAGRAGDPTDRDRFPDGTALRYDRYFFIGHGDIGSIVDQYVEVRGIPYGTLSGHVLEAHTGLPMSGANVFVYEPGAEAPWSQLGTDVHPDDDIPDGSFEGRMPTGDWEVQAHLEGRPVSARIPITVVEGEAIDMSLVLGRAGALRFEVRDEMDQRVPAKVTVMRLDQASVRNPLLGDGFIGGSPAAVAFSMYGEGTMELPPGRYQAIASRGPEYEIDMSEPFEVDDRSGADIELVVRRSVQTDGWISADLHVHGVASHDSSVTRAQRVGTMVAEGVEFFASTDHDYIVDYAPVVEELGLEQWVQTAVGVETTTIELGHFLGFPIGVDHLEEAGGAFDWTGARPAEMLDALRARGQGVGHDPVTFVGHPRDGILGYFDQYGFDPYSGTPGRGGAPGTPSVRRPLLSLTNPLLDPGSISWTFDGLEMLNGKRFELIRTPTAPEHEQFACQERRDGALCERPMGSDVNVDVYDFMTRTLAEQQDLIDGKYTLSGEMEGHIDDWFTLLNLGFKFTVLGNSDTHGFTGVESGCPRNFVMAETDDPAFLDDQAIADAVKAHRVVASYGPFVQLWGNGEPIGSELVTTGEVELAIDVQAPTWMGVDRVELYENGTLIQEWEVEDIAVVDRFQTTYTVTPTRDSWYVVAVASDDDMRPVLTPVELPYVELQAVVTEALGSVESVGSLVSPAAPIPRTYPAMPYAITNPIWVDRDGDGFDAPGNPAWLVRPR
ncbi:MAG: CehA/McbA family metallohydrolase [Alphaproteobacteria bacterium]|nr:CehA/McbA family metallohydrolase [Alphaproteobacteria bacterium]